MTTTTPTIGAADLPEARLFTKKPVTISAIQWTGKNLREVITFTDGPPDTRTTHAGMAWEAYADLVARDGLKIYTLEGKMLASHGDWIIRGVKGEFYPCKNDIFEATYSPADVPTNGVAAIKTTGTKDDPITSPSAELQILKAEHDNLKSSYGRLQLAYDAWHEKTAWIHKTIKPAELGQHIADVMTARLLCLGDKMTAGVIDAKQMTLNAVDKAPKDGTVVLMWLEGSDIPHPARFQDGKWRSSWDGDEVNSMVGWMHIPNVVAVK